MSITLNGTTGITTPDIDSTAAPDLVGTNFTSLPSAQLTGALPAIDGSSLTGIPLSNPNLVINGSMEINQRGNKTGLTTTGYTLDRHNLEIVNMGTLSVTQDTDVPAGLGFSKSMKIQCTATQALDVGSSRLYFIHRTEGFDSVQTMYGTADAKDVTLSFWIKANRSQTLSVNFENEATSGANPDQGYQTSQAYTTADTWQKMSVTIPGDTRTGMGFVFDSAKALCFEISLSTGYTSVTPSATWSTLNNAQRHGHNTEHFADSTSNYFNITGVKLELGDTATPFEHISYGDQLQKCMRYFQKFSAEDSLYQRYSTGICFSATSCSSLMALPVTMRAKPTIGTSGTASHFAILHKNSAVSTLTSTPTISSSGTNSSQVTLTGATTGLTVDNVGQLIAKSTSAYLAFDAEL